MPHRFLLGVGKQCVCVLVILIIQSITGASSIAQNDAGVPDWFGKGNFTLDGKDYQVIETEDFFLRSEASLVLMDAIRGTVNQRIDTIVGTDAGGLVPLTDSYIQRKIVDEELVIEKSIVDPTTQRAMRRHAGYARLCFDGDFVAMVRSQYQLNFKARRLQWTGLAGMLTLCWLATAYGYLRLDNATRHFYSRRLQTLAIISCLIPLIVVIFIAAEWGLF